MRNRGKGIIQWAVLLVATASFAAPAGAVEKPPKIQTWTLASGKKLQAAIVNYSRQRRMITLELPNGNWVHVPPRDLAGASKFQWLKSDAFRNSLSGYKVPTRATARILPAFLSVTIGALLASFLAFWMSAAYLLGERGIRRAATTYLKFIAVALGIGLIGAALMGWVNQAGNDTDFGQFLLALIPVVFIFLAFWLSCRIVGRSYGSSMLAGMSTLGVVLVLFGIGSIVVLYGLPRLLNQPGIDEWFTEQILSPLQLV